MIGTWIWVFIIIICGAIGAILFAKYAQTKVWKTGGAFGSIIVAIGICVLSLWVLYGTESGKRSVKSFESNVKGGINRTVTVYDIEGDVIAEYSGKFDIDHDGSRIIFDDENEKRHTIYYSTATVIIDEQ